jgi:N-terminal region of glycosyl transferase group 7/N-terminal domain of galactosyltransferase
MNYLVVIISYFSYVMILYNSSHYAVMQSSTNDVKPPPKYIFIVPYRDREPHRVFFSTYIYKIMDDVPIDEWSFYFIHQCDKRPFNRGAMKNIGFLAIKSAYPNHYKDIIFIFNDIDTLPYDKNILNYYTDYGVIKHFYGFQFALGGIFSIRGVDFERINGFPNYWAWGGEDNLIHERAKQFGLTIDRSNFFTIGNTNILQFADGMKRLICRDELATSIMPNNTDGLTKLTNVNHTIYYDTHMIDVTAFDTFIQYTQLNFEEQSLDKVSKIRVSPLNAVRNIKQLQSEYTIDANKQIHSVQYSGLVRGVSSSGAGGTAIRNNGVNTINQPLHVNLPFMFNPEISASNRRSNSGLFAMTDRPSAVSEQERMNTIAVAAMTKSGENTVHRVYQNIKQNPDVIIPLQRPKMNTNVGLGIHAHKQFGMRGLFM